MRTLFLYNISGSLHRAAKKNLAVGPEYRSTFKCAHHSRTQHIAIFPGRVLIQFAIVSITRCRCLTSLTTRGHRLKAAANLYMVMVRFAPSFLTNSGNDSTQAAQPVTSTYGWASFLATWDRALFAIFMGLPALTLLILLWIISVPLIAANLVVWFKETEWYKKKVRSTRKVSWRRPIHNRFTAKFEDSISTVDGNRTLQCSTDHEKTHPKATSHARGPGTSRRGVTGITATAGPTLLGRRSGVSDSCSILFGLSQSGSWRALLLQYCACCHVLVQSSSTSSDCAVVFTTG